MNNKFLCAIVMLAFGSISASEKKPASIKDFYHRNERGQIVFDKPIEKAIFHSIARGASPDFVQDLINASRTNSPSPSFNQLLDKEIKVAYRRSPILAQIESDAQRGDYKAVRRSELQEKAKQFKKRYAGGEHY